MYDYKSLDYNLLDKLIVYNNKNNIIEHISEIFNLHKERFNILDLGIIDNINITINLHQKNSEYNSNDNFIIIVNNYNNTMLINDISYNDNIILMDISSLNIIINNDSELLKINDINDIYNKKNFIKYIVINDNTKNVINNQRYINNIGDICNNIFIINNQELLTHEDCDFFKNFIEYTIQNNEYSIEKWDINTNVICKFFHITNIKTKLNLQIDTKLFYIFNKLINYLYDNYNIICRSDSGYCFRKIYGPTNLHCDTIFKQYVKENENVNINEIRNMSVIICLNDDYDGGEFFFPIQKCSIKLKKGDILAFPPYWTHPHMVNTPLNRTYRYTINSWLYQ